MEIVTIDATTISDAWFQCLFNIWKHGEKYIVEHGSYEGETRLQYPYIVIKINKPYSEPYDSMLPQIPVSLNIPNPVADGYIEQYLPYIMTDVVEPGEDYSYGNRIYEQINYWIKILKKTPNTNQAVLQVAQPSDFKLKDPPCLRMITVKIIDNELRFNLAWRSWELWSAFSANLAAIAVLQKYMADEIGVKCGPMIAASDGLHLYGYIEEIAKLRVGL